MPKSVLCKGVCYKYCVYPDKTSSDYAEEDFKTDSFNYRYLQLSKSGGKPIIVYKNSVTCVCMIAEFTVKFDAQVFPEGGLWERFKTSVGVSRESHTSSAILALRTLLPIYYTDVCNANPASDIVGRAKHLEWLFSSLSSPKVYSSKSRRVLPIQLHLKKVKKNLCSVSFSLPIIVFC